MRYYSSTASSKTLSSSVNTTATTITLNNLTGLPASYPYTLVLDPDTASEEIVLVTSLSSGTTLNVTRGTDTYQGVTGGNGTAKQNHNSGAVVKHMITARDLQEPQDHIAASSGVHGLTGSVVGTSDAQTLTNKTISGSNNTVSISSANISDWTTQFNTKANLNSPTFSGTVVLPSTTSIGNVTSTEIGYLDNVTSAIQTQLNNKAASSHTHAVTDITGVTASAAELNVLDGVTATTAELNRVVGVTSGIQDQLNAKAVYPSQTGNSGKYLTTNGTTVSWAAVSGTGVGDVTGPASSTTDNIVAFSSTTGKAIKDSGVATSNIATLSGTQIITGAKTFSGTTTFNGNISASGLTITPTELSYLDGVTSAIQGQIDNKANTNALSNYALLNSPNFTGTVVLPSTTSIGNVSSTEIGYLDGVTGLIQNQFSDKANLDSPVFSGIVSLPSTTSIGNVDSTEIGYLNGVTAAIQTQLNNVTPLWYRRNTDSAGISSTLTSILATSPSLDASSWYYLKMYISVAASYTSSSPVIVFQLDASSAMTALHSTIIGVGTSGQKTSFLDVTGSGITVSHSLSGNTDYAFIIEGFLNTNLATTLTPKMYIGSGGVGSIVIKRGSYIQLQKLAVSTESINGTWT